MSENLMHVSVYFDSFNTKQILNQKVYEVKSDLLSPHLTVFCKTSQGIFATETTTAIGGQLSLYLGVSIAMVFEVLEIILDLLANTLNWLRGRPLGRRHHIF